MAGSKSAYLENALLNHTLGAVVWTPPSVVYVALSSVLYDENATGAAFGEILGGGISRVAVPNDVTHWPTTSNSLKVNGTTITFPAALTAWPEARSFYILDALTNGNILYGADLATPRTLAAGDTASFGPSAIKITED